MTHVRVVIDSNVYISAFLFGGHAKTIINSVLQGKVHGFISLGIIDEVRGVIQRPKSGLSPEQALRFVEELHFMCELVSPEKRFQVIPDDPDDDMVLDCAYAGNANFIISGDSHLLNLKAWKSIQILSPSEFVESVLSI